MTTPAAAVVQAKPLRLRVVRILAWVMVAVAAIGLFGLADLMTLPGWVDQQYEWEVPIEASWGSLFTFVIAGSFANIALQPRRPWPGIVLLAFAITALLLGSIFGLDGRPLPIVALLTAAVVLLLWLGRKHFEPFPRKWALSWPYLLVAAAGVPLWVPYALHALKMSRMDPNAGHLTWNIEHWPIQGSAGIALCLTAAAMVFWPPGRQLMRISTSLSSTYIGAAMLAYPYRAGAMDGPMWGVAMVLWGTVVALLLPPNREARGSV
jgi:hypothetical protein